MATELLLELAGARWTAATDAHDELPERPVIAFRPERADAVIGVETPPERSVRAARAARLRARRRDVVVPTWRARDVTREIDVVEEVARFRLEDVPFTLPARRAMFGTLTREQQLRRRVEDTLVGPRLRRDLHAEPRPDDDTTVEAARADLGRADRAAHDARPEPRRGGAPQRRRGRARHRAVRDRARVPAGRRPARRARARRGHRRGRLPAREGRRRGALRGAQGRARVRARRASAVPSRARPRARRRASSASSTRACSTESGVRSSSTSRSVRRLARAGDLRGRDHLSGGSPGHRRVGRRGRRRSAISSRPHAKRRARSSARSACSTSTAASRSARGASRSRSRARLPGSPIGRSPRKTRRGSATRSRRSSGALRRRAPHVDQRSRLGARAAGTKEHRAGADQGERKERPQTVRGRPVNGSVPLVAVVPRTPVVGDDDFEAGETADFAGDAFRRLHLRRRRRVRRTLHAARRRCDGRGARGRRAHGRRARGGRVVAGVLLAGVTVAEAAAAGVDDCVVPQLEELAGMLAFVGHGWQLPLFAAIELYTSTGCSYRCLLPLSCRTSTGGSYRCWQPSSGRTSTAGSFGLEAGIEWS